MWKVSKLLHNFRLGTVIETNICQIIYSSVSSSWILLHPIFPNIIHRIISFIASWNGWQSQSQRNFFNWWICLLTPPLLLLVVFNYKWQDPRKSSLLHSLPKDYQLSFRQYLALLSSKTFTPIPSTGTPHITINCCM